MNGIINILKPAGMTSHDVVSAVRRILNEKKAGHTGTLDPMAVGVLPVCLGGATRIIEYLDEDYKKYRCELQLGLITDTEDIWGTVLSETPVVIEPDGGVEDGVDKAGVVHVCEAALLEAAGKLVGEMMQTPPSYSAVRVGGRRLYEYARSGETVAAAPRKINIRRLSIIKIDHQRGRAVFDVESSKGSYIRTLCTAIGEALGCGAAMSFLVRTAAGRFELSDAVTFEELEEAVAENSLEKFLKPADYPLSRFHRYEISNRGKASYLINGGPLDPEDLDRNATEETGLFILECGGEFIAMAHFDKEKGRIISDKVFCRELQN